MPTLLLANAPFYQVPLALIKIFSHLKQNRNKRKQCAMSRSAISNRHNGTRHEYYSSSHDVGRRESNWSPHYLSDNDTVETNVMYGMIDNVVRQPSVPMRGNYRPTSSSPRASFRSSSAMRAFRRHDDRSCSPSRSLSPLRKSNLPRRPFNNAMHNCRSRSLSPVRIRDLSRMPNGIPRSTRDVSPQYSKSRDHHHSNRYHGESETELRAYDVANKRREYDDARVSGGERPYSGGRREYDGDRSVYGRDYSDNRSSRGIAHETMRRAATPDRREYEKTTHRGEYYGMGLTRREFERRDDSSRYSLKDYEDVSRVEHRDSEVTRRSYQIGRDFEHSGRDRVGIEKAERSRYGDRYYERSTRIGGKDITNSSRHSPRHEYNDLNSVINRGLEF